jgi:replicative DNA helicase
VIIAARPSMGKTAFALCVAQHVATAKEFPVAIFSLEMTKKQLINRMLCSQGRVDSNIVRRGEQNVDEWERLALASNIIGQAPIYVDDTPGLTMQAFRSKARRVVNEHGIKLIIADYLQLFSPGVKKENREKEVSYMSRQTKALAKELNIPILMLSQLSRALENRNDKRPQLSDLRDSGSLEQDADTVLFIYRDEVYNSEATEGVAEIIIGKQRNGPVFTAEVAFIKQYTQFCALDSHHYQQEYTF